MVDLPYDEPKIRVLISRNIKTSMSTQWKFSHKFKDKEDIKSEKEAIEMFTFIANLNEGQWLLPKLKDWKHIHPWFRNNLDKFHQYFTNFTFLQFIWNYEKLFGFRWKEREPETIHKLLLKPKTNASPKGPHLNDLNLKDLVVILGTFRTYCAIHNYEHELVLDFFNRIFEIVESDSTQSLTFKDIGGLLTSARFVRLNCDEIYDKLTQMAVNYLDSPSDETVISHILTPLARANQHSNFDLLYEKAVETGILKKVKQLYDASEIVSGLVLMVRYDSPFLVKMLK